MTNSYCLFSRWAKNSISCPITVKSILLGQVWVLWSQRRVSRQVQECQEDFDDLKIGTRHWAEWTTHHIGTGFKMQQQQKNMKPWLDDIIQIHDIITLHQLLSELHSKRNGLIELTCFPSSQFWTVLLEVKYLVPSENINEDSDINYLLRIIIISTNSFTFTMFYCNVLWRTDFGHWGL